MNRPLASALVALVVVSLACTGDAEPPRSAPTPSTPASPSGSPTDLVFPVNDPTKDGMDALMEGTLVRHERCLYTEVNGRRGPLLIWPHGFSYREQGPDVVILDDDGEAVGGTGKRISMAGGLVPLRLLTTRLRAEAGKCTNRPSVWLVSGL